MQYCHKRKETAASHRSEEHNRYSACGRGPDRLIFCVSRYPPHPNVYLLAVKNTNSAALSGCKIMASKSSKVLLPQPLNPTRATFSPWRIINSGTVNSKPSSPDQFLVTLLSWKTTRAFLSSLRLAVEDFLFPALSFFCFCGLATTPPHIFYCIIKYLNPKLRKSNFF